MCLNEYFYNLLRIAIGNSKELPHQLSNDEWESLYNLCKRQAILGIVFVGIQKLRQEQMPPVDLLEKWREKAQRAKERNELYNRRCKEICDTFYNNGFENCIVKGQSNLVYYPEELKDYRTARGLDIISWQIGQKAGKREIMEYVNFLYISSSRHVKPKVVYHHVDWDTISIPVDVRIEPSYFNCPWHDKRFQKWLNENVSSSNSGLGFPIASTYFNVVYQLVHLYRRLFCEGISIDYLVDFYYVLIRFNKESINKEELMHLLSYLGMRRFTTGVMYVLKTVFDMADEYLLCPPSQRAGKFVLTMTMRPDYAIESERHKKYKRLSSIKRLFTWTRRNWRFLPQYPLEVFFDLYRRMVV